MKAQKKFVGAIVLMLLFFVLTYCVLRVDVKPIGPKDSIIGLSTINYAVHEKLGVHLFWYKVTQILGAVALLVAALFALLGVVQLIRRRSFAKVDKDIYLLAGFYALVMATYFLFEVVIINYRPIILPGKGLEASFPSSHAMVAVCILGTGMTQVHGRIKKRGWDLVLQFLMALLMIAIIFGRLISGVHWFTDILAGTLLGFSYVLLYDGFYSLLKKKEREKEA